MLTVTEVITYTNNSPDRLDALWLQIDQNLYRKTSRSQVAMPRRPPKRMLAALQACAIGLERVETLSPESRRIAAHYIGDILPADASEFEHGLALGLALALFSEPGAAILEDR